jgi:diguanylate cyclase
VKDLALYRASQPVVGVISRILRYPTGTADDEAVAGRIRAEQINNTKRYLPSIMLANACNALVLIAALWASPQRQFAVLWASTVLIFSLYYGVRNRRSRSTKPSYVSPRAIMRAARNATFLGTLWAMLPLLFFPKASPGGQIIITCLCAGMLAGGAFASASIPIAAIAFTAPIVVASAIAIGSSGDAAYLMVAVLMISYVSVLWRGVFVHASQIAKRVAEQVQLERKVRRDDLTSLPNRLVFAEALERAFARLTRLGERFAVLYLDLNDFKAVNDHCGHATGDKLLIQVGERLKACIRQIDLVARLSGDEFAVIVADAKDRATTTSLANRIIGSLDAPFLIDGAEVFTGACIGIAFAPTDGGSPEALLKSADEALYDAKRKTAGAVQLYDFEHKDVARRRRRLERQLRSALRGHEFFLVYQPISALDKNSIVGCEALLRWRHPTLGIKLPHGFADILEETGLINQTGDWIFLEACKTAASWPVNMRVAVNVSAIQLRYARILSSVVGALAVSGLSPERLEIEITETAVLDDSEQVLSNLNALRELGVRIALDDFGTGYSSLTHLRKVSPDSIKIDASFVREVMTNSESRSIVKSLINLSRDLNINVVAEGIETAEQLHLLLRYHCAEGQGHFISEPKSAGEIGAFLRNGGAAKNHAA